MPGSLNTPSQVGTHAIAPAYVAFRVCDRVGAGIKKLSRLNGWPMRSLTDASPLPSRARAHGSGPMQLAMLSSQWTHHLLLAGLPAHHEISDRPFASDPRQARADGRLQNRARN